MIELVYPVDSKVPVLPNATVATAGASRRKKVSCDEMFPVIQEDGLVVAMAGRVYCHSGSHLLHPVVHLHIIDREERLLLQKRSLKKDLQPGKWDTSVGGHIRYGESVMEALYREAAEEVGLTDFNPIYLGSYRYDTDRDSEYVIMFATVGTFDLHPDKDEVDECRPWTLREIEKGIKEDVFTSNFASEFKKIKSQLLSLL